MVSLRQHPVMQCFDDRHRHLLTYSQAILIANVQRLAFELVQAADRVQGMFSQLTFVRQVQIKELATGVDHAADFSDSLSETGFVASEVVADQLTVPVAQEITRMFASAAWAEVINQRFERRKRLRAVGLDIGLVGFLLAWRSHL